MRCLPPINCISLILLCLLSTTTYAQTISGTFIGKVVNKDGTPIPGARVTLPAIEKVVVLSETRTDSDGNFTLPVHVSSDHDVFTHRRLGRLDIEVDNFGADFVASDRLTLFPDEPTDLGEIVIHQGKSYTGLVLDPSGKPAANARVECESLRFISGHTVTHVGSKKQIFTNEFGIFTTPIMPIGIPSVEVHAEGFETVWSITLTSPSSTTFETINLRSEMTVNGNIRSKTGEPIESATLRIFTREIQSDARGGFQLNGLCQGKRYTVKAIAEGYATVVQHLTLENDGIKYFDDNLLPDPSVDFEAYHSKAKELLASGSSHKSLDIVMEPSARIRGRAIDSETGEPVSLSKLVACYFTRKPDGSMRLDGCRVSGIDIDSDGRFQIQYSQLSEYHLSLFAEGYHETEAITPMPTKLEDINDIVVRMTKKEHMASTNSLKKQYVHGKIENFHLLNNQLRAALWRIPSDGDLVNVPIMRGRTGKRPGAILATTLVLDQEFTLQVPYPSEDWYVILETPKGVVAIAGPFNIESGATIDTDLQIQSLVSLQGRVNNFSSVTTPLHAIAFSKNGFVHETPVRSDGSFQFENLLPGQYAVKIGSDEFRDSEVPEITKENRDLEETHAYYDTPSDTFKNAKHLTLELDSPTPKIEIDFEP